MSQTPTFDGPCLSCLGGEHEFCVMLADLATVCPCHARDHKLDAPSAEGFYGLDRQITEWGLDTHGGALTPEVLADASKRLLANYGSYSPVYDPQEKIKMTLLAAAADAHPKTPS